MTPEQYYSKLKELKLAFVTENDPTKRASVHSKIQQLMLNFNSRFGKP